MSLTLLLLAAALCAQAALLLRVALRPQAVTPSLTTVLAVLAMASAAGVLVHAYLRRDPVLFLGQALAALFYLRPLKDGLRGVRNRA